MVSVMTVGQGLMELDIMSIEKPLSPRSPRFLTLFRIDKHIEAAAVHREGMKSVFAELRVLFRRGKHIERQLLLM